MFANTIKASIFWPIIVGIVLLGGLLYLCTCFIYVKKNHVAIIEKAGEYLGTYKAGLRFFGPVIYRRVGMYQLGEIKQKIKIEKEEYLLTYEIENAKDFHYLGHHDIEGAFALALKAKKGSLSDRLTSQLKSIGVKFIKAEEIIE